MGLEAYRIRRITVPVRNMQQGYIAAGSFFVGLLSVFAAVFVNRFRSTPRCRLHIYVQSVGEPMGEKQRVALKNPETPLSDRWGV